MQIPGQADSAESRRKVASKAAEETKRSTRVRTPVQQRSRQTYERILTAATELISEGGFEAFTTNAVAERAGVNIASLYAYFNDKYDILSELIARFEEKRTGFLVANMDALATDDWREWVEEAIDKMAQFRVEEPGGMALRRSIMGSLRLAELDRASLAYAAEAAAERIEARNPSVSSAQAAAMSKVVFASATEVLDQACLESPADQSQIDELKKMVVAYLAGVLDLDQ